MDCELRITSVNQTIRYMVIQTTIQRFVEPQHNALWDLLVNEICMLKRSEAHQWLFLPRLMKYLCSASVVLFRKLSWAAV